MDFSLRKGFDIAVSGAPDQTISEGNSGSTVALLGADYPGLRPNLCVEEGTSVSCGQVLFTDRKIPTIRFVAPASGTISAINFGPRRSLSSVVITTSGTPSEEAARFSSVDIQTLSRTAITDRLLESGLWTALRRRPFGDVPDPASTPRSLFITAIDTHPLAANPEVVMAEHAGAFKDGLCVLSRLIEGAVYLCVAPNSAMATDIPEGISVATFQGEHPAGLVGTHIHFIDPVSLSKSVWHLGYQDVIAVGALFGEGRIWNERVVSLAGPMMKRPRLVRYRLGGSVDELVRGEIASGPYRAVSGSVLSGRWAGRFDAYLGRYHTQVSVVGEQSLSGTGGPGPMVGIEALDGVMPLDILAGPLLRSLLVGDTDMAMRLGCLELDEEDVSLLSFMCASGTDYGPLLGATLTQIAKEARQ